LRYFLGHGDAPERLICQDNWILHVRRDALRANPARSDGENLHALGRKGLCERLTERINRSLRGRVRGSGRFAAKCAA
jgi:hypothetical protein